RPDSGHPPPPFITNCHHHLHFILVTTTISPTDTTFASIPTATNNRCHTTIDPPSPTSSPRDHRGCHQLNDAITTYGSPQQPTPTNLRRPPPLPVTTPPTTTTTHLPRHQPHQKGAYGF
nr:hypothetical protein [Tanacetum cinerariifolium]